MRRTRYHETREEPRTGKDLQWGGIIYLQNTSTTLTFADSDGTPERIICIYGSPLTLRYGTSVFQYPNDQDVWTSTIPANTDILITHSLPWGHLDGVKKAGYSLLAREVARVKPRLVVFGHIHVGYGTEEVVYDPVGRIHQGIIGGWARWAGLMKTGASTVLSWIIPRRWRRAVHTATFVNAAVIEGWQNYKMKNEAVVINI